VSAILIEDLGKCFEFPARWCSQRTNRGQTVAGRRTGLSVLTQGSLHDNGIAKRQSRLGQCSGMHPERNVLSRRERDPYVSRMRLRGPGRSAVARRCAPQTRSARRAGRISDTTTRRVGTIAHVRRSTHSSTSGGLMRDGHGSRPAVRSRPIGHPVNRSSAGPVCGNVP
jgi:hypothetical protein